MNVIKFITKNKTKILSIQDSNFYENIKLDDTYYLNYIESSIEFNELIECLNDKEKIIMILYYNNLYTTREISNILEIKENTVKSIVKRAKNKIKNNLKGEDYEKTYK